MLRDKIGLVCRKIYTSKQCQFEDVTIIPLYYCITCTLSSLSCLLAFYDIPISKKLFYLLVKIIVTRICYLYKTETQCFFGSSFISQIRNCVLLVDTSELRNRAQPLLQ